MTIIEKVKLSFHNSEDEITYYNMQK